MKCRELNHTAASTVRMCVGKGSLSGWCTIFIFLTVSFLLQRITHPHPLLLRNAQCTSLPHSLVGSRDRLQAMRCMQTANLFLAVALRSMEHSHQFSLWEQHDPIRGCFYSLSWSEPQSWSAIVNMWQEQGIDDGYYKPRVGKLLSMDQIQSTVCFLTKNGGGMVAFFPSFLKAWNVIKRILLCVTHENYRNSFFKKFIFEMTYL